MKNGRALELLVAHLERISSQSKGVIVESPLFLKDKTNDQKREFDVGLIVSWSHHKLTTVIECKDWSQVVGSPEIEAFATKCSDCLVNDKVFISPSGFTEPALKKAEFYGIRCIHLNEVSSFPWLGCRSVVEAYRKLDHLHVSLIFDDPKFLQDGFKIGTVLSDENVTFTKAGVQMTFSEVIHQLNLTVLHAMNGKLLDQKGNIVVPVEIQIDPPLLVQNRKTGRSSTSSQATGTASISITEREVPLSFKRYEEKGQPIPYQEIAATPSFTLGDKSGKLAFVNTKDGIQISLLIDPKK